MSKSFLLKDSATAEADWFDAGTFISGYTSGFYSGTPPSLPSGTEWQTLRYSSGDVLEANDNLLNKETFLHSRIPMMFDTADVNSIANSAVISINNTSDLGAGHGLYVYNDVLGSQCIELNQQANSKALSITSAIEEAIYITQNGGNWGVKLQYNSNGMQIINLGSSTDTYPLWITDGSNAQFAIDGTGRVTANKFYKKANQGSVVQQYNNIVADEEGNYEKQWKNISIKQTPTTITLTTPVVIPEMVVYPMRSNFYHLDFRLILEKQIGGESEDVMYENGMQFIFSNSTANDVTFFNGLTWRAEHYYNATLEAQAHYHKHANFNGNQVTDALINSVNTNVHRVVLHGEGVFMQHSGSDLLNLKLAYVTSGDYTYSVAAGSYMKIELKNEGA